MITTFILSIFYGLLNLVVGFLPTGHLPTSITTAVTYFINLANSYSFIIPVDTLLQAMLVILFFDSSMIIWYFVNWVIRKIPGMQ